MEPPVTNHQSPITGVGTNHQSPEDDEISLLDLAIVLAKFKWLILGLPLAAAILAVVYSRQLPNIYTASVKLLPPQSQSATVSLGGALGGALASIGGGVSTPPYIGMLKSRVVADGIIQRLDLNALFHQKLQSATRAILGGMTNIKTEKDGMLIIEVDNEDPKLAAIIANAYADEISKLTNVLAVTDASRRGLFYERQFALAKDNLAKAEVSAKQALEKGGIIQVEGQGRAMIEATARLRAQISFKEVQIGSMRAFAAERNPELFFAQQEVEAMKRELAKMEGVGGTKIKENSAANNGQGIDSFSLLREVKYYETIYELLAKQYELAKMDEAKDSAIIQVLDKAIEPDFSSKPNRRRIVLLSALAALFAGIALAFFLEAVSKAKKDPQRVARLQAFKRYLAWR